MTRTRLVQHLNDVEPQPARNFLQSRDIRRGTCQGALRVKRPGGCTVNRPGASSESPESFPEAYASPSPARYPKMTSSRLFSEMRSSPKRVSTPESLIFGETFSARAAATSGG